jgi:hypothetical protein
VNWDSAKQFREKPYYGTSFGKFFSSEAYENSEDYYYLDAAFARARPLRDNNVLAALHKFILSAGTWTLIILPQNGEFSCISLETKPRGCNSFFLNPGIICTPIL